MTREGNELFFLFIFGHLCFFCDLFTIKLFFGVPKYHSNLLLKGLRRLYHLWRLSAHLLKRASDKHEFFGYFKPPNQDQNPQKPMLNCSSLFSKSSNRKKICNWNRFSFMIFTPFQFLDLVHHNPKRNI